MSITAEIRHSIPLILRKAFYTFGINSSMSDYEWVHQVTIEFKHQFDKGGLAKKLNLPAEDFNLAWMDFYCKHFNSNAY